MAATSPRQRRTATTDDIDRQIAALRERKKKLQAKAAERFSRLAVETGLSDLNIPDDDIKLAFLELLSRFRGQGSEPHRQTAGDPPPAAV